MRRKLSFSSVTLEKLGSGEARQQRERARAHTAKWEREVQFLKSRSSALLTYFTPEAGGANGEGYHNFNHTLY